MSKIAIHFLNHTTIATIATIVLNKLTKIFLVYRFLTETCIKLIYAGVIEINQPIRVVTYEIRVDLPRKLQGHFLRPSTRDEPKKTKAKIKK